MRFRCSPNRQKNLQLHKLVDCLKRCGHDTCVLHICPDASGKVAIIMRAEPTSTASAAAAEIWT
eukprot:SAG22_NODE_11454_length_484_cov_1.077922_1_plen_63_part_01